MKNKGIIPINKPQHWTSFDVVNKLKYKLKPLKVGHLGTLDPMATGVLLVTVGKATKLFDIAQEKIKTYIATFEFGYETDTLDACGKIKDKTNNLPTLTQIEGILSNFVGEIEQIPPKYSAKSVNGRRAYEMARNNVDFELKAKKVKIKSIKLLEFKDFVLKLEIECGSGTYIRALGRDISYSLNTLATMTKLVRTKVGSINIDDCYQIDELDILEEKILPIKDFLKYPIVKFDKENLFKILNGQTIDSDMKDGLYQLIDGDDTCALVKIYQSKAKMFMFLG